MLVPEGFDELGARVVGDVFGRGESERCERPVDDAVDDAVELAAQEEENPEDCEPFPELLDQRRADARADDLGEVVGPLSSAGHGVRHHDRPGVDETRKPRRGNSPPQEREREAPPRLGVEPVDDPGQEQVNGERRKREDRAHDHRVEPSVEVLAREGLDDEEEEQDGRAHQHEHRVERRPNDRANLMRIVSYHGHLFLR